MRERHTYIEKTCPMCDRTYFAERTNSKGCFECRAYDKTIKLYKPTSIIELLGRRSKQGVWLDGQVLTDLKKVVSGDNHVLRVGKKIYLLIGVSNV